MNLPHIWTVCHLKDDTYHKSCQFWAVRFCAIHFLEKLLKPISSSSQGNIIKYFAVENVKFEAGQKVSRWVFVALKAIYDEYLTILKRFRKYRESKKVMTKALTFKRKRISLQYSSLDFFASQFGTVKRSTAISKHFTFVLIKVSWAKEREQNG